MYRSTTEKSITDEMTGMLKGLAAVVLFGMSCGIPLAIKDSVSPCYQQAKRTQITIPVVSTDGRQYEDVVMDTDGIGKMDMVQRYEIINGWRNHFPSEIWALPSHISRPIPPSIKVHPVDHTFFDKYESLR